MTIRTLPRLQLILFLFVCSLGVTLATAQDYSVSNLSLGGSSGWVAYSRPFNAQNQLAGTSNTAGNFAYHAFFHDGTTLHDLGTLGGSHSAAAAISDGGQVVGWSYAVTAGTIAQHAFSWTQAGGLVDLGTLGGESSEATAINNAGQIVGHAQTPGGFTHAFMGTQAGGMVDLGTLGGDYSFATGINDTGQVIGYAYTAGNSELHAFLWSQAGGMVDLGTLGGMYSFPTAINNAGQVIGYAYTAGNSAYHAFSWTQAGGMIDLGTLGGSYSYPTAINDAGQVIGHAHTAGDSASRAFFWTQAGGLVDLGTLGGSHSLPVAVNDAGQVIGYSHTAGDSAHRAFFWTQAGGLVDLSTLGGDYSYPAAINDAGQVVGYATITSGKSVSHAFSWTQAGGMIDLNDRITSTAPPGMELYVANAVSDAGSIVADSNAGLVLLGVSSTAPVLGPISANDPVAAGTSVSVNALFTDVDATGTHTAVWTWGDGSPSEPATVSENGGSGTASGSHVFSAAGIYAVSLEITDSAGLAAQVSRQVVVYDPSAGFVTGGGWIISPPGAYKAASNLAGRATFGFVSKYKQGATVPTGNTEFQFHAAGLSFHSDSYDWLVVAGARAQYRGTGTINGSGSYKFMLTAIDGNIAGGGGVDRFRIKIWYYDATLQQDVVVYDNQTDSSGEGTLSEGTVLRGGSIVIHK